MNTLAYFLTASLYLLLFFGCYVLLLRRTTFFGLNRAYLLGSVVLSLLLPLLDLSAWWPAEERTATFTLPTFQIGTQPIAEETSGWSTNQWLWLMYGLGVTFMLIRLAVNLRAVYRLIRQGKPTNLTSYILVRLPHNATSSFSFGRFLVLNQTDAATSPDALLRHEEAHIRQQHTADILFIELVWAAFWFNPVLLLYKRALQEVHEFLADRSVLRTPQPDYPHQLVAYALGVSPSVLITPFASKSTLKQRIVMLQKPLSHRRALLGYALVLPLAGLLTLCTQPNEQDASETQLPATIKPQATRQAGINGEVFMVVEKQPEFPGGMAKLGEFLAQNLRYPAAAQRAGVQGRVFVRFIITKEGEVRDAEILKGIGFGTDEEALRIMKAMPRWIPGSQSGKPVNVQYNLPIKFELEAGKVEAQANENLRKEYDNFLVNGKKVSFEEYQKAGERASDDSKYGVNGGFDRKTRTAYINYSALETPQQSATNDPKTEPSKLDVKNADFFINGQKATQAELEALPPNKIATMDVNKKNGRPVITIRTK